MRQLQPLLQPRSRQFEPLNAAQVLEALKVPQAATLCSQQKARALACPQASICACGLMCMAQMVLPGCLAEKAKR